jgi:hypothetical protein
LVADHEKARIGCLPDVFNPLAGLNNGTGFRSEGSATLQRAALLIGPKSGDFRK